MQAQPEQHCSHCPMCGGDIWVLPGTSYYNGTLGSSTYSIRFTASEARTFDVLWKYRGRGAVSWQQIHDHLYANDPNGGPLDKVIHVLICRIRKKLRGTEMEIVTDIDRGYRLRTINARAKVAA